MYVQPLFMVLMGRWGQRYEKLGLVRWGIIGSVITFGVYASAPNIWQIVLAQVMIAIAWSAIFIGLNLYLIERTSENARGRAFGLLQASLTTAAAAGPFVGGPLSDYWGMQSMIWVVAAMMALSLPFLWRLRVLDRARARLSPRQDSI
jgi:MFS family permease